MAALENTDFIALPGDDDDEDVTGAEGDDDELDGTQSNTAENDSDDEAPTRSGDGPAIALSTSFFMHIEFDGEAPQDATGLQTLLALSLRGIYGQVGAAIAVDVLHIAPQKRRALVRVPYNDATRVRNALTLITENRNGCCQARVVSASPFLLSLVRDHVW